MIYVLAGIAFTLAMLAVLLKQVHSHSVTFSVSVDDDTDAYSIRFTDDEVTANTRIAGVTTFHKLRYVPTKCPVSDAIVELECIIKQRNYDAYHRLFKAMPKKTYSVFVDNERFDFDDYFKARDFANSKVLERH